MSKNFDSPLEIGFCGSTPDVEAELPPDIEMIRAHALECSRLFPEDWEVRSSAPYGDGVTIFCGRFSDNKTIIQWRFKHLGMQERANHILAAQPKNIIALCDQLKAEIAAKNEAMERVRELLAERDHPEMEDFVKGVPLEAAHQRVRWGNDHDAGKAPSDWFWLIGYLAGKCLAAHVAGNREKALHHTISTAAALANWHLAIKGATNMRPGIGGETEQVG